jgi:uncharacterized membrane protein YbhN (UPF0104 family)
MIKKILLSKWTRIIFSLTLLYFAYRTVDLNELINGLKSIPLKWVIINIIYSLILITISSFRWSTLLLGKPNLKITWDFTKASLMGAFYSLFFPTGVAGDFLKWLPLKKKYPKIKKFKLFSSVFLDRLIGFTAFIILAFLFSGIGLLLKFEYPQYLFWLFFGLTLGVLLFYVVVMRFNIKKYLGKLSKFKLIGKLNEAIDLLKNNDKKVLVKCLMISFVSEFLWIMQVWVVSKIIGAGFTVLSVFIFLPIIALILLLPVSIAGFGAREYLYVIFFSQVTNSSDTKILLVSSFMGILGITNALFGGLLTLF